MLLTDILEEGIIRKAMLWGCKISMWLLVFEISDKGGEGNELINKPREVRDEEDDMESWRGQQNGT